MFYALRAIRTYSTPQELGAKTKYLRRKGTNGFYAFVVLRSVHPRDFATVIERAHVYTLKSKSDIQLRDGITSGNQSLDSRENCWRLCVRLSAINPSWKL